MIAKASKTRPSTFGYIMRPLSDGKDRAEGRSPLLPRGYSMPLTTCTHGAEIRGNESNGKNASFDLLLAFESVCTHASRQPESDTPASKYHKSLATMFASLV